MKKLKSYKETSGCGYIKCEAPVFDCEQCPVGIKAMEVNLNNKIDIFEACVKLGLDNKTNTSCYALAKHFDLIEDETFNELKISKKNNKYFKKKLFNLVWRRK